MNLWSKSCMDSGMNSVVSDRRRSSSPSETDSGPIGGSGRRKFEGVKLEIIEEGRNSKHLKENMAVMDKSGNSARSRTLPEEISGGSDSRLYEGTPKEGFPVPPTKKLLSQPSSSSNSSETSDLLQADANKVNQSGTRTIHLANPHHGINIGLQDGESDGSTSISSTKSEKSSGSQGPTSASQVSDITNESVTTGMSPTQSPPVQTMDRLGGYDPFRIPSSVFQRSKSTTPMEWSVASNESLFSIHVGNNSFSRDHIFMLGDLGKSGELTKSGELIVLNPPTAIIPPNETERESTELEKEPKMADIADNTIKDTDGSVAEELSERKVPPPVISWNSSNVSQHSDGSESSTNSFAFPIKKKRACPSCYCSNCSWAFCYYLWPSCYFTWPSCYCWNCSRAFRYCWNCSRKRLCCHSSNILADGVQSESSAAHAKKKHPDTLSSALSSKSRAKSWFPCCYSFPSCSCCSCYTWSCCCCHGCCHFHRSCHDCCHFRRCCHFRCCCPFHRCCRCSGCCCCCC